MAATTFNVAQLRLASSGASRVHVQITLDSSPVLHRALRQGTDHELAGVNLARPDDVRRSTAIEKLDAAAEDAMQTHGMVARHVEALGGAITEHDLLTGAIKAYLPRESLAEASRLEHVAGVEESPVRKELSLEVSTGVVGAPAWWTAGYSGGRGAQDRSMVDLAIVSDKIEEEHPAFMGVHFQRPADAPVGTSCGQWVNGCEHGTEVASMAISRGAGSASAGAAKKGVTPGLTSVLDAHASGLTDDIAWALGVGSFGLAGADDPAEVLSNSHGSVARGDDSAALQGADKIIATYGALIAYPAGNEGPARSVNEDCIAYNTLCMGGFTHRGTVDPSDDVVEDFSSRGPTPGGRKKPDLVAVSTSEFANAHWIRDGRLWSGGSGTSLAAPQGAAGAALLAGAGIGAPIAQKAVLINSARQGRATPASPMGTQTGWQADWGWGALDLEAALREKNHLYMREVAGGDAHFYRANVQAPKDRATLVWNRRALGCLEPGCDTTALTLSNLELEQLDPATGAVEARSASAVDNVEQVRSPGTGEVIYKVKAASTVDGLPGEPYALAARRQVTPLVTPRPTASVSVSTTTSRPGDPVQVMAEVRNPSPDLSAESAAARLDLPAGVALAPGSNPATQAVGDLAPGGTAVVAWTVRATGDALNRLTVATRASRYGETFEASADASFTSDGTAPSVAIAAPAGRTTDPSLAVSWSGADAGSGLRDFEVDVSTDDGPYVPWLIGTTATAATYSGSPGRRYRFRVRATDRLGTTSGYAISDEVAVVSPPEPPPVQPPVIDPPATKTNPALRVRSIVRRGSRIRIAGTMSRTAFRRLTFELKGAAGKRRVRVRGSTFPRAGRFKLSVRAPRGTTATLTLRYAGDDALAATATRVKLRKL
jgi:hypothetical protein